MGVPAWAIDLPWEAIREASRLHKLNPLMVAAIIQKESSGNTYAVRFEPLYKWMPSTEQTKALAVKLGSSVNTVLNGFRTSWGLMQVMGAVAYEHGFQGWFPALCRPEVGIDYGCRHFKKFLEKYPTDEGAIAAYNAGSAKKNESGFYLNQRYVDDVMRNFRELENA